MISFQKLKNISQKLTILYVEDDCHVRNSVANTFSKLFKDVELASDGKEGFEKYEEFYLNTNHFYDVVVSDIRMPGVDGIQMCRNIFKLNKKQKIIMTSAYSDKEYFIDLINLGVNGFLQKPLTTEQILHVFNEVISSLHSENIIELTEGYRYDSLCKVLFLNEEKIKLTEKELRVLDLLIHNKNRSFKPEDIFNYIYYDQPDREFSADSIKGLLKRLRKKFTHDLIKNQYALGYGLNLDLKEI